MLTVATFHIRAFQKVRSRKWVNGREWLQGAWRHLPLQLSQHTAQGGGCLFSVRHDMGGGVTQAVGEDQGTDLGEKMGR